MKKPSKPMEGRNALSAATREAAANAVQAQGQHFARAIQLFHAGEYRKAQSMFDDIGSGPVGNITESARMYSRMCAQRLQQDKPALHTPEEHYHYGVSLLNERRFDEALNHLQTALAGAETADVHYALTLALGLSGRRDKARGHLQQALQLDPRIRSLARSDSDFQPLLDDSEIRRILVDGA